VRKCSSTSILSWKTIEARKAKKRRVFNSSIDPMGYNRFVDSTGKSRAPFLDPAPEEDNSDLNDFPEETTMEGLPWTRRFSHKHTPLSQ
jgi:hypothetical protein